VDFDPSDDQQAILEAVGQLLDQHAGAERAIALAPKGAYDFELAAALEEAGFLGVADAEGAGPLDAALVVEAVARAAGTVAVGAEALVVPGLGAGELARPVALASADHRGPLRFLAHARTLLVADDDAVRVIALEPGEVESVRSSFGFPVGRFAGASDRLPPTLLSRGQALGAGSALRLRDWWRLALALEASGAMRAALDETVAYLKQRRQFGHPIASFQAVQHRLADCAIAVEGSRWLAYEAAYYGAPAERAATAASYALAAAGQVFAETHQLSGAIGFTREHDLHVWTMRLRALCLELGGTVAHRRALTALRWGGGP